MRKQREQVVMWKGFIVLKLVVSYFLEVKITSLLSKENLKVSSHFKTVSCVYYGHFLDGLECVCVFKLLGRLTKK